MHVSESLFLRHNLRDIASGSAILKPGKVYRMGKLFGLSEAELAYLQQLGITDCVDLRSPAELEREPDPEIPGWRYHHIPLSSSSLGLQEVLSLYRVLAKDPESEDPLEYLCNAYVLMLEQGIPELRAIIKLLLCDEHSSILIHCAGGKDRTGFVAAILSKSAGCSDSEVVEEYLLSKKDPGSLTTILENYVQRFRSSFAVEVPREAARVFIDAHYMPVLRLLEALAETYGGIGTYLRERLMLTEREISDLTGALRR